MKSNREHERGAALFAVMLLVLVATALASLAASRGRDMATDATRERGHTAALYAAEGGLAKARHALRADPQWCGGELRIGDGDVVVRVTRTTSDQWRVTSQATTRPGGAAALPVRVTLTEQIGVRHRYRAER